MAPLFEEAVSGATGAPCFGTVAVFSVVMVASAVFMVVNPFCASHPAYAPWGNHFVEECAIIPNGAHNDQVDAMTQALLQWNLVQEQTVIYYAPQYQISPI